MILFLTKDLMIQSSAASTARANKISLKSAATVSQTVESLTSEKIDLLLVDLQTPGLDVADLLKQLSSIVNRPPTIAFAQHVQVQLLQSAEQGVFEQIMTRGQFNRSLPEIISKVAQST